MSMPDPKCCCGLLKIKTATWVIAICELIGSLGFLGQVISGAGDEAASESGPANIASKVLGYGHIFMLIVIVQMMWGLKADDARFLLPYLVVQIIFCVLAILTALIFIIASFGAEGLAEEDPELEASDFRKAFLIWAAGFLIYAGCFVWLIITVKNCYMFINANSAT